MAQRHMVPLMLLHIVIIIRLNITQTGWHISSPQFNSFVGQKAGEKCPLDRREDKVASLSCVSGHELE